jgi:hypothetical protein
MHPCVLLECTASTLADAKLAFEHAGHMCFLGVLSNRSGCQGIATQKSLKLKYTSFKWYINGYTPFLVVVTVHKKRYILETRPRTV